MSEDKIVLTFLLPTKEQIEEEVRCLVEGPPVFCWFTGYPPLPGERTYAYQRRVMPRLWQDAFPPKRSIWHRLMRWGTGGYLRN